MGKVLGGLIELSGGRFVFLGENEAEKVMPSGERTKYIGFKSKEGNDTKIILSPEAYSALKRLISDSAAGGPLQEFPHEPSVMVWQHIKVEDEPQEGKSHE